MLWRAIKRAGYAIKFIVAAIVGQSKIKLARSADWQPSHLIVKRRN